MKFNKDYLPSLAGSLLIAHPAILDDNFRQSVVLLSSHTPESGGIGVAINHPLNKTLQEMDPKFAVTALADVPIYLGGPIANNAILLVAWEWLEQNNIFKLHFGISEEQAASLRVEKPSIELRAFLGHSKWLKGQLENEVQNHTWFLSSVKNLLGQGNDEQIWLSILTKIKPELLFLVDPEHPSNN